MKRMIILMSAFAMVLSMSVVAFASQTFNDAGFGGNTALPTYRASTKVNGYVNTSSTGSSFAAADKHLNGDRTFGTASDSTSIFYNTTVPAGSSLVSDPLSSGNSAGAFASGWTSM